MVIEVIERARDTVIIDITVTLVQIGVEAGIEVEVVKGPIDHIVESVLRFIDVKVTRGGVVTASNVGNLAAVLRSLY
jgi:hypothetical protein